MIAVSFAATCETLAGAAPGVPCFVTGTPIRDTRAIDREAASQRLRIPPGERVLLIFGGSQAVRRFNGAVSDAIARLVEHVTVIHVTGDDGYAAALTDREALPRDVAARYRPFPFLRDDMLPALAVADLVVGRAGSSTLAEVTRPRACRWSSSRTRTRPATSGRTPVRWSRPARPGSWTTRRSMRRPCSRLPPSSRIRPRTWRCRPPPAPSADPGAADAVADLVLAAAERRPLPDQATIDRRSRGAAA